MFFRAVVRAGAVLAGVALGLFSLWASLIALLVGGDAFQEPNPFILDGDPCCGHPDDWGEVALGAVSALVAFGIVAAVGTVAAALGFWGSTGRWPRPARLVLLPGGVLVLVVGLIGVAQLVQRPTAVTAAACDPAPVARGLSGRGRERALLGIIACGTLDGAFLRRADAVLGPGRRSLSGSAIGTETFAYDRVDVDVRAGRVVAVRLAGAPGG